MMKWIINFKVSSNRISKSNLGEPKDSMQSCPKTIEGYITLIREMEQEPKSERVKSPWKIGVLDVVHFSIEE
jgi:hypothetical protein